MKETEKIIMALLITIGILGAIIIGQKFNDQKLYRKAQIETYEEEINRLQEKLYNCESNKQ